MLVLHVFSALTAVVLLFGIQPLSASAQTKITIGVAAMSPRTIPLLIAQEQGLFAKHGLEARNVRRLMATQNPKVTSVKIEEIVDNRIIRKLDDFGYIDKAAADYGLK